MKSISTGPHRFTPYLGARVRFRPSGFVQGQSDALPVRKVVGEIVYINHSNRYYLVRAQLGKHTLHESFKF